MRRNTPYKQQKMIKVGITILGTLVIGIALLSTATMSGGVNAEKQTSNPHSFAVAYPQNFLQPQTVPLPPTGLGCYQYTITAGWQNGGCISESWLLANINRPLEGNQYGVYGENNTSSKQVNYSVTFVNMTKFSGETDSKNGTGAFSIQTNTNYFNGNNSKLDWVQFVYQKENDRVGNGSWVCEWNINVQDQQYYPTCMHPDIQNLTQGYGAWTEGYVNSAGRLDSLFCSYQQNECWAVVANDKYHLAPNWKQSSGTILGEGALSEALFTSPANETTTITMLQSSSAVLSLTKVTGEQNNLNVNSKYIACGSNDCVAKVFSGK